jgi:hypothetical protein
MSKKITIRLPDDIYLESLEYAIKNQRSMSNLVHHALVGYLKKYYPKRKVNLGYPERDDKPPEVACLYKQIEEKLTELRLLDQSKK